MIKIKWENYSGDEQTTTIQALLDRCLWERSGKLENVENHSEKLNKFCVKTVELLYQKGVLDKEDILHLITPLEYFDNENEFKIITT